MLRYRVLETSEASRYRSFTFPAYRHLLMKKASEGVGSLAVGASLFDRPVGLALAGLPPRDPALVATREPELLSIFVESSARRKGIGGELLGRLQGELGQQGYQRLTTSYLLGKPSIPYFEKLLAGAGWEPPQPRTYTIRFTRDEARQVPWFQKYELGPEYEMFPWASLNDSARDELKRSHQENAWIDDDLVPWKFDAELEPVTSLGLRRHGKIVGWVINQVMDPETVRMTCVFVRRDLQRLGKILPVLSESLDLLQTTPYLCVSAVTRVHHPGMISFFKRWCGPWASFLDETRESAKALVPVGSA